MTTLLNRQGRQERQENNFDGPYKLGCVETMLEMESQMLSRAAEGREELTLWEATDRAVVLGLGGKAEEDLHLKACEEEGVPVLRRITGGGTVFQGPGILNVALALKGHGGFAEARALMERLAEALAMAFTGMGKPARAFGAGDVAEESVEARKLAGLASRGRGKGLLAHASILVKPDLGLMERLLKHPRREPEYRRQRSHHDFLGSLPSLEDDASRMILARALSRALDMEGGVI